MKIKLSFVLIAVALFTFSMQAQREKPFSISFYTGYDHGINGYSIGNAFVYQLIDAEDLTNTSSKASLSNINLGKGIPVGLTAGYLFSKYLGAALGVNYIVGGVATANTTEITGDYTAIEVSKRMIQIRPSLVLTPGLDKVNPYIKMGPVLGMANVTIDQNRKVGSDHYNIVLDLTGGLAVGFQSSFGVLYPLNDRLRFFGELTYTDLFYEPTKGEYTVYSKNGVSQLPTMNTYTKEIDFVDTITSGPGAPSPTNPQQRYRSPLSFSSIGLHVGLHYSL